MQFDNDEQRNFFVGLINNYVNALNNSKQTLEENIKNVQGALKSLEMAEIGCCSNQVSNQGSKQAINQGCNAELGMNRPVKPFIPEVV
jgi:hypothetical protein